MIMSLLVCAIIANSASAQREAIKRLIGSAVSESDIGPEYDDVGKAIVRFSNRDFDGAESLLKNVRNDHPELPPVGVLMGQLFSAAKDGNRARQYLEQAVRDDPKDPEAFVIFGDSALQQRRITDAALLFSKADELCSGLTGNRKRKKTLTSRAKTGLALVAEAREDWSTAVARLKEISLTEKNSANVKTRLGRALFKQGNDKDAYAVFQEIYNADTEKMARPEISMSRLYQQDGKSQQAEKLIRLALERDGDNLNTQMAAAQWALETGNVDTARTALAASKKLNAKDANVFLLTGMMQRYDEKYDQAADSFEQAHLRTPGNAGIVGNLALVLAELPDEESQSRALAFAQTNLRMAGENQQQAREATVAYAYVLAKAGRQVEAGQALQKALQGAKGFSSDTAFYAAQLLADSGRDEAARQILAPILKKTNFFANRKKAQRLLAKLNSG